MAEPQSATIRPLRLLLVWKAEQDGHVVVHLERTAPGTLGCIRTLARVACEATDDGYRRAACVGDLS